MTLPIILIGPICSGKSTVAPLLAEQLGLTRLELDEIRWPYYREAGFDQAIARELMASDAGIIGFLTYCKPFEAHAVARVVEDHPDTVIDFGAGHSVYEDEALFARVEQTLAPLPHVFLLLPSPQADESVAILNARFAALLQRELGHVDSRLLELNEHFVRHPSNARLAKRTFYTEGKTPQETCAEMLETIRRV